MLSDILSTVTSSSSSSSGGSVKTRGSLLDFITSGPSGSAQTYRGSMTPGMEKLVEQMLQRVRQDRANL